MEAGLRLLVLGVAAACSGPRTVPPPQGSGSPGSAAIADAAPVAPVAVGDRATADANLGKPVVVHGTAKNAKLAAAVTAADLVVYCLGVDSWPTALANQQVTARGTLEHTDEFASDGTSGGTSGKVYVLRACAYEPH